MLIELTNTDANIIHNTGINNRNMAFSKPIPLVTFSPNLRIWKGLEEPLIITLWTDQEMSPFDVEIGQFILERKLSEQKRLLFTHWIMICDVSSIIVLENWGEASYLGVKKLRPVYTYLRCYV